MDDIVARQILSELKRIGDALQTLSELAPDKGERRDLVASLNNAIKSVGKS